MISDNPGDTRVASGDCKTRRAAEFLRAKKSSMSHPSLLLLLTLGCAVTLSTGAPPPSKKVVCYFSSGSRYAAGARKFTPDMIDPHLCTHVLYAFATIDTKTSQLTPSDPHGDITLGGFAATAQLKKINPNLKVLLSVGGRQANHIFPKVVHNDTHTEIFIRSAIKLLREINFDGLDIDWEFPGSTDKERFPQFLQKILSSFLDESMKRNQTRLLLTGAVESIPSIKTYGFKAVCDVLDFVNLMTYDFYGLYSIRTGPNSPLFYEYPNDPLLNSAYAVAFWLGMGCPREKIVMGMAQYGKWWQVDPAEYAKKGPWGLACSKCKSVGYKEMCTKPSSFDSVAAVEYGIFNTTAFNYDSVRTMEVKGQFIMDMGLGGAMLWQLATDDFNGKFCNKGKYPLLSAISHIMMNESSVSARANAWQTVTSVHADRRHSDDV